MTYERLSDDESRERVAAIIAAAESLANDDVDETARRRPKPPTQRPSRWAVGMAVIACVLAGLAVWTRLHRGVTADTSEKPQVLHPADVGGSSTSVAPSTTRPSTIPTTTVPATVPATTVPATTTPATTPTTTAAGEAPHRRNDPRVASFTAYAGGGMTIVGKVADQATADLVASRAKAFLPVTTFDDQLQIDPTAPAPVPLIELRSDFVFDHDSATLRLDFSPAIIQMAGVLKANTATTLDIYVHTDDHAPAAETMAETQQQADALKAILVAQGVDPARIQVFPEGATQLIADGSDFGKLLNRRVELVVNGLYS